MYYYEMFASRTAGRIPVCRKRVSAAFSEGNFCCAPRDGNTPCSNFHAAERIIFLRFQRKGIWRRRRTRGGGEQSGEEMGLILKRWRKGRRSPRGYGAMKGACSLRGRCSPRSACLHPQQPPPTPLRINYD